LFWRIFIWLVVVLAPAISAAAEPVPRSVLIVAQWDSAVPWYAALSSAFRTTLRAAAPESVAVYAETLDLGRFNSQLHKENFRRYLQVKYREKNIDVIVAVGSLALEFMLGTRSELWPAVPMVFSSVDEATIAQLKLPPDVTGSAIQLSLHDMVAMARVLMPTLQRIALVGQAFDGSSIYRNFKQDLLTYRSPRLFNAALEVVDLTGLPMADVRKRVAVLPENTAILYTGIFIDGAGVAFNPTDALAAIAEVANRPIVISTETQLGYGAVGGLLLRPGLVGDDAARLTSRILNGESAANIPVVLGNYIKPIFDWTQLTRWRISESRLPTGSELRFRQPNLWDQYRWLVIATLAVVLAQAAMITWLYFERRRRRIAEMELRQRLLEVIHLNRVATAGVLSASVAHELNQPLGAIQSYSEAAELYLKADPPNLERVEQILANIRRDNQRAAEVISHLRGMLKKGAGELQEFDLNDVVRDALYFLDLEASKRGVVLSSDQTKGSLPVRADQINLQQVILNLAVNGMDAMQDCAPGSGKISIQTALVEESATEVSIADSGTGIPMDKLNEIFDTFYTTKQQGTGLGLSISRTIIETYGGRIWAENRPGGGAVFRFTLPLSKGRTA
jgi:signal transduction histidine kinase